MKTLIKWFAFSLLSAGLLSVTACAPRYKDQPDCGFNRNVYGERISWKGRLPIEFRVHNSFPQDMIPALENAMNVWEKATGRRLFTLNRNLVSGVNSPSQDGINVIYMMSEYENDKNSEQARTTTYSVSDEIREADIRLNDKDFNFYIDVPRNSGRDIHIESLLIHELGHVLGLKHNASNGSVMATTLSSSTVREILSPSDIDNIRCEY